VQDSNNQPLLRNRVASPTDHQLLLQREHCRNFVLFGDNILECLSLLNPAVAQSQLWEFVHIAFEQLEMPTYVFRSHSGQLISVSTRGVYSNWSLPARVSELIYKYDLPDFVLYDIDEDVIVFAGELTETASVGNSQWQRELRKIAAAELGVPFVYQTAYSGKDDGQDTIREPTSLLVHNALLYSVRHRVPSLVFFVEPNIESSRSRERSDSLAPSRISDLFIAHVLEQIGEKSQLVRLIETEILRSMVRYLKEPKLADLKRGRTTSRLERDLPCLKSEVLEMILRRDDEFVESLLLWFDTSSTDCSTPDILGGLCDFDQNKLQIWTDKKNVRYICDLFDYISLNGLDEAKAPLKKFAAGILPTEVVKQFVEDRLQGVSPVMVTQRLNLPETVVIPVVFHKGHGESVIFTKDPYAGNTAAFAELLGFDCKGKKSRSVITYCVSENPSDFDIDSKKDTTLYKALAKYSDLLIVDSRKAVWNFEPSALVQTDAIEVSSELAIKPLNRTEDMALTALMFQLGVVASDWSIAMVSIHHSSWQQLRLRGRDGRLQTVKIGRDSAKVDLVLQASDDVFLVAEGKKTVRDFFRSSSEEEKIRTALVATKQKIDELLLDSKALKFSTFVCHVDEEKSNDTFATGADIRERIRDGSFGRLAGGEFVVVGLLPLESSSRFIVEFSQGFPTQIQEKLSTALLA